MEGVIGKNCPKQIDPGKRKEIRKNERKSDGLATPKRSLKSNSLGPNSLKKSLKKKMNNSPRKPNVEFQKRLQFSKKLAKGGENSIALHNSILNPNVNPLSVAVRELDRGTDFSANGNQMPDREGCVANKRSLFSGTK